MRARKSLKLGIYNFIVSFPDLFNMRKTDKRNLCLMALLYAIFYITNRMCVAQMSIIHTNNTNTKARARDIILTL